MTLFSIAIRDDGEVLNISKAPHQADDCDGLVYRARDNEGNDILMFFIASSSQDIALQDAVEKFKEADYVALDPMWQPGSVWPDTADESLPNQALVLIFSDDDHQGYITTVLVDKRNNPFIHHFGQRILWAYMRDIEQRATRENAKAAEDAKEYRRRQAELAEAQQKQESIAPPIQQPQQLYLDFG